MLKTEKKGTRVYLIDCETFEPIDIYNSISECADDLGINPSSVYDRLGMAFHTYHDEDFLCSEDDFYQRKYSTGMEIIKKFHSIKSKDVKTILITRKDASSIVRENCAYRTALQNACDALSGMSEIPADTWKEILTNEKPINTFD